MVIISAIVNVSDLVTKATELVLKLPDTWYKGSSELNSFKSKLNNLRLKAAQWTTQLDQFGMSEDPVLKPLLDHAVTLLDEEDDYYEKHRNKRAWKFKRRLFPTKLTYILNEVLTIVDAGPQLLQKRIEAHELLAKNSAMRPSSLPFDYDPKYVPSQRAVDKVHSALEDAEGPRVVILYGEPGIGKSSLAKHVALLYEENIRGSRPSPFGSVQYLFCGKGCHSRIRQLQKDLLSNLGLAVSQPIVQEQDGDQNLSFYQTSLTKMLTDRKLLIILDDVWAEDRQVLVNLISRGNGIRYLVTSQTRGIWFDARNIEVSKPDDDHALQILIRHTEGLSIDKQAPILPQDLKREMCQITRKLENHPLSLVNVAVSVRRHQATNSKQWMILAQNIYAHLDHNHCDNRILVYGRPYSLSVSTSMMLMVESLPPLERQLLFLVAMMENEWDNGIPAVLVRVLFRSLHHDSPDYKYFIGVKYLEDNSLLQVHGLRGSADMSRELLTMHDLRRQFIRQKKLPALRHLASGIMAPHGGQGRHLVQAPDGDHHLAVVLGALYCHDSLVGEVTPQFQSVVKDMNWGIIPRSVNQEIDAVEVIKSAKRGPAKYPLDDIVKALLPNVEGDEGWKQQVRADASKMVMKLVCKHELDDEIMASLLIRPHTTAAAVYIFEDTYKYMYLSNLKRRFYFGEPKSLSATHPKTWRALLNVCRKNITLHSCYGHRRLIIEMVLEFEPEATVLGELEKLFRIADQSSDPRLKKGLKIAFLWLHESRLTCKMLANSTNLEDLPTMLWRMIHDFNQLQSDDSASSWEWEHEYEYWLAMDCVQRDKDYALKLLTFPVSCDKWLTDGSLLRSLVGLEERYGPLSLLGLLSGIREFGDKVVEILEDDCCPDFTRWPESYDGRLARFWGNVALVKDLHQNTRLKLVQIAQRWIAELGQSDMACFCACKSKCKVPRARSRYCEEGWAMQEIVRTVTIIRHFHANLDPSLDIPDLEDRGRRSQVNVYWGQAQAQEQMAMYAEAVANLKLAGELSSGLSRTYRYYEGHIRSHMIFVKAMAGDYAGAMDVLNHYLDNYPYRWPRARRECLDIGDGAVLFRLNGELSKAISEFDRSLERWELECEIYEVSPYGYLREDPRLWNFVKYLLLAHRGYAKHLANDHEGSKVDAKSAQELRKSMLTLEPASWEFMFDDFYINYHIWLRTLAEIIPFYFSIGYLLLGLPVKDDNFL